MFDFLTNAIKTQKCQICQKQAQFLCSKCQNAKYCSKDHQLKHWKAQHKNICQFIQKNLNSEFFKSLEKKRVQVKRSYFQNYSTSSYEQCLIDAKVMADLEKQVYTLKKTVDAQFDYGSACLLIVKTLLLLDDSNSAQQELQKYIIQENEFIHDTINVPIVKKQLSDSDKSYILKKMNLVSGIANLCYAIGMKDCIKQYINYTKHVEKAFGADSLQISNCYFLIGCYFVEEGYFNRAIACFNKAGKLRGVHAGDCYFNIGVLYKLQNKLIKSLQMFEIAFKSRQEQYGEDSDQVAQVYQNTAAIYLQLNDFKTARMQYDKALKIRGNNPYSPEYQNIIQKIQQLYRKLMVYIESGQPNMKKTQIYTHLQSVLKSDKIYWPEKLGDQSEINRIKKSSIGQQEKPSKKSKQKQQELKKKDPISISNELVKKYFNLDSDFLLRLNPSQLFRLSELQLELQNCHSDFALVFTVSESLFFKTLSPQRMKQLELSNPILFEMIKIENAKLA